MIYSSATVKNEVIEFLRKNKQRFKGPGNDDNYIIECPYCGDSISANHGHFYIKINPRDNSAMKYNCFRCPAGGIVTKDVLERLGFSDKSILDSVDILNRNAPVRDIKQYMSEGTVLKFDHRLPAIDMKSKKLEYLQKRMGMTFSERELNDMKVITSLKEFLWENKLEEITCHPYVARLLEEKYIGFLSFGNSYILFRDVTDTQKYLWVKYPITRASKDSACFYSMYSQVDPFCNDDITINLSEGVMDTLGVAYHLDGLSGRQINIAVGGKGYEKIIRTLIQLGFVGDNITIRIFSDNDAQFNKKAVPETTLESYRKLFNDRKKLFKKITVTFNLLSKDFGVSKSKISTKSFTL